MSCLVCMLIGALICYILTNKQARDKIKLILERFGESGKKKKKN